MLPGCTLGQLERQKYSFSGCLRDPTCPGPFASLSRHRRQHQQRHHGHSCPQLLSIHSEKRGRHVVKGRNTSPFLCRGGKPRRAVPKSVTSRYFGGGRQMKGGGSSDSGGMAWRGSVSHPSFPLSRVPISTSRPSAAPLSVTTALAVSLCAHSSRADKTRQL